jgi:predicted methyltransferase
MRHLKKYLQYIINTNGNATLANFDDDWEPIGPMVRAELHREALVQVTDKRMSLTTLGQQLLDSKDIK